MFYEQMIIGLLALLILGFCVLIYIVWKLQTHYNRLTRGTHSVSLSQVLDGLLGEIQSTKKRVADLEDARTQLESAGMTHIQRIGVVRFNPFSDTGGAQSFTMAILDAHHDGIVMTSLYGRNGNRWYVKQIVAGTGKDIELSKEELSAIQKAIRNI
ncbi:DUF4446 family protein [Candidatus Gottesmanbacteria bacterium]|nr:DUF4446 family protein [Candidatus Gottesmanbacteria bacterium]